MKKVSKNHIAYLKAVAKRSDWHRDQYFPKSQRENLFKGFLIAILFVGVSIGLLLVVAWLAG